MGSQPGRPLATSQLRLFRRSVVEEKMMRVMMEWEGYRGKCNRFPGICLTTEENPGKPQLGNRRGSLTSVTSYCFKWGTFPPNEVGRATLPAPLAKPIGSGQKSVPKKSISRIRRSRDLGRAPPDHSKKF